MANKQIEDMDLREKGIFLNEMWNKADLVSMNREIEWALRVPNCLCDAHYQNWLNEGKDIYKNKMDDYEEIVRKENIHREQMKLSRQRKRYIEKKNNQLKYSFA
jgi:hypothetical protein